jgi:hypothetical protein
MTRVRFSAGAAGVLSLRRCAQRGSGILLSLVSSGSRGIKRPGRETDHLPPSSAEVKNVWSCYTSTPPIRFMAWYLFKHRIRLHDPVLAWALSEYMRLVIKVKLSLCLTKHHAMKAYWESGCIAPRILDLGTIRRWVVSFTPRPLYPQGKSPRYSLDRRLGGPQSRSGRGGEEKNSHSLPGLEPSIIQPIAQRCTTDGSSDHNHTMCLGIVGPNIMV